MNRNLSCENGEHASPQSRNAAPRLYNGNPRHCGIDPQSVPYNQGIVGQVRNDDTVNLFRNNSIEFNLKIKKSPEKCYFCRLKTSKI